MAHIPVHQIGDLAAAICAVRKAQSLRQDEIGRMSHTFIGDLESGKPTVQLGKVLEVLTELGITLHLGLPSGLDRERFDRYVRESPIARANDE